MSIETQMRWLVVGVVASYAAGGLIPSQKHFVYSEEGL